MPSLFCLRHYHYFFRVTPHFFSISKLIRLPLRSSPILNRMPITTVRCCGSTGSPSPYPRKCLTQGFGQDHGSTLLTSHHPTSTESLLFCTPTPTLLRCSTYLLDIVSRPWPQGLTVKMLRDSETHILHCGS